MRLASFCVACAAAAMLTACESPDPEPESLTSDAPAPADGPVHFVGGDRFRETAGLTADPGDRVVFGATIVRNSGDTTATLTSATLADEASDAGAQLKAVRVVDVTEGGDTVGAAVWPFENYAHRSVPLPGFTLPPGGEAELLFLVDVPKAGTTSWARTELVYEASGTSYTADAPFGFEVCTGNSC